MYITVTHVLLSKLYRFYIIYYVNMYIWTIIENKHCKKKKNVIKILGLTWNSWPSIHFLKQFWGRFSENQSRYLRSDQLPNFFLRCTISIYIYIYIHTSVFFLIIYIRASHNRTDRNVQSNRNISRIQLSLKFYCAIIPNTSNNYIQQSLLLAT